MSVDTNNSEITKKDKILFAAVFGRIVQDDAEIEKEETIKRLQRTSCDAIAKEMGWGFAH